VNREFDPRESATHADRWKRREQLEREHARDPHEQIGAQKLRGDSSQCPTDPSRCARFRSTTGKCEKVIVNGANIKVTIESTKVFCLDRRRQQCDRALKMKTLANVIEFNKQNEAEAMPFFKQEILEMCEAKDDLTSSEYKQALYKTLSSRLIIDNMMADNKLDAICGVTNGLSWCIDLINGDYDTGFSFSTPAAISGYPHITVPMGLIHNLPIGLSFMGSAYTEPLLISLAYSYEQATKKRVAPTFIPNSITG